MLALLSNLPDLLPLRDDQSPATTPTMPISTQALAAFKIPTAPPVNTLGVEMGGVLVLLACVRTALKFVPSLTPPTEAQRR